MSENTKNRHEYIAAVIFCIFLCLPLLATISPRIQPNLPAIEEKRVLTKFPGFPEINIYTLKSYTHKYEKYFNDQFGLRKLFLRSLALYRFHVFGGSISSDVMIGKEDWLFANRYNTLDAYRGYKWFSSDDLIKIKNYLEKKQALLAERGIDYLYVIAPNKQSIYPEYFPARFTKYGENYVDTFVEFMRDNSDVDILDLRHSLIKNKNKGQLYYRTDTHWNSLGAYYAYREIFSDPKKLLSENSFGPAHLRALNLIERNPGTNLGELMFQLKITKQSLNRVLRDLIKAKMIKQIKDEKDTRKKNLFLDKEGKIFFDKIYESQKKRIFDALKNSEPDSVIKFKEVLNKIINGKN